VTWLKLSDDFSEDCVRAGLSDSAYRTHVDGLIWTMRRGTDGTLDQIDIRKGLDSERVPESIEELCAVGFWRKEGSGYRIVHHMEHQPEAAVVEARKAATAERVRKHRMKKAGVSSCNNDGNALPGSGLDGPVRNGSGPALDVSTDRRQEPSPQADTLTSPAGCYWCHGEGEPNGCPECGQIGGKEG
jgi:hypothetical protein